jgi:hypothetical protein
MPSKGEDVRFFVNRVKDVAIRLEAIAEKAAAERVEMLDGLNIRATSKSVSTLERLCDDVESRLERLRQIKRAG